MVPKTKKLESRYSYVTSSAGHSTGTKTNKQMGGGNSGPAVSQLNKKKQNKKKCDSARRRMPPAIAKVWPGRIPQLTCESKVNVDIKKKRHRPHQHVSHSSSRGVKQNGEKKLMCQLEQNPQEAGVCRRGSRGGEGENLHSPRSSIWHFYTFFDWGQISTYPCTGRH